MAEKHKLKHYRSFVQVDELTTMEFREQRISILNHDAVIFTSKNSMDHYFGMMDKLRLRIQTILNIFVSLKAVKIISKFYCLQKEKVFTGEERLKFTPFNAT